MRKEPKPMSPETKARIQEVIELFKGKTMFPEALKRAKEMFKGLK